MNSKSGVLRLAVIMYVALSNITLVSTATDCYQCSTTTKAECGDLLQTDILDKCKTTTEDPINCIAYMYKLNGKDFIYRGCRKKSDTCDDVKAALMAEGKEFRGCGMCDTNFCKAELNASTTLIINVAMIAVLASFSIILR